MTWPFTPVSMIFATLLAASGLAAAIALENARLYAEVQQLVVVDELTGLYNRRGLVQFGEREFTRSARFARPLSALMIDLDHFKTVNDTYGHAAGDRVLRQVADCLRSKTRSVDILARYGGEELLLLLPEADLAQATQVAERLRLANGCIWPLSGPAFSWTASRSGSPPAPGWQLCPRTRPIWPA